MTCAVFVFGSASRRLRLIPMKLIFDASVLGIAQSDPAARTGVYRVAENLLQVVRRTEGVDLLFSVFQGVSVQAGFAKYLRQHPELKHIPILTGKLRAGLFSLLDTVRKHLPQETAGWKVANRLAWLVENPPIRHRWRSVKGNAVLFSPFWPFPEETNKREDLTRVLQIHDLFEWEKSEFLTSLIKGLRSQDWVVCVSESTKREVCSARPDIPERQIAVVPNGVEPWLGPVKDPRRLEKLRRRIGIGKVPFLLCVATLHHRKNISRLVEAFLQWVEKNPELPHKLVFTGANEERAIMLLNQNPNFQKHRDRFCFTGYLPDRDLPTLYSLATALVFPSLHEGFGIPVLEAMRCGLPVITSNVAALPEVAGGAARYVDPLSVDSIEQAIYEVLSSEELRETLRQKGFERSQEFTWAKSGQRLLEVFYQASLSN
jgi:glycosyltransferase involved in cell wall biosynthesis